MSLTVTTVSSPFSEFVKSPTESESRSVNSPLSSPTSSDSSSPKVNALVQVRLKTIEDSKASQLPEQASLERTRIWKAKVSSSPIREISDDSIQNFSSFLSTLSYEEATVIFARFLFIFDKKPQALQTALTTTPFTELVVFLETTTQEALKEIAAKFHPKKSKGADIFKSHGLIHENRYAIEVAKVLLLPNGTLNIGLIEDVKKYLLIRGSKATSLDTYMHQMLDDLKDPQVQAAFEKIGKVNETGAQIVRATLCLQAQRPLTTALVRTAALASFLARVRHLDYHNCYAFAVNITVKARFPEKVFAEYNAILENGALTRVIDGTKCTFLATPKMALFILKKELTAGTTAKKLWEIPHLAKAFATIGATEQSVTTALHTLHRQRSLLTLENIFNTLQTQNPYVTQESLQQAYFIAAAASEMPLSRVWNNAISSMFFTPFTMKYKQLISNEIFKASFLRTLTSLIEEIEDPKVETLVARLTELMPRIAKAEINGEDFSAILPHFHKLVSESSGLAQKERTKLIQKDKELKKIRPHDPVGLFNALLYITEDLPKKAIDLTAPHFVALDNLRFFVEPPSALRRQYAECCLYIRKEASFTKITSANALGQALKEVFSSIVKEMKANTIADLIEQLPDADIAQKFQSFFTPLLSCDVAGTFNTDYDNTPWSFMIAPSYFDTFWGVYFESQKIDTPSKKINFSNNPNAAKELLEWAETIRTTLSADPKMLIPAKYPGNTPMSAYPGHAITLTPNHPTMIPKLGQTVEAMLQEKMKVVQRLRIADAENAVQEAKTWAKEYLKIHLKDALPASKINKIIQKFKNEMAQLENNPELKLETYLETLCEKVTENIAEDAISAVDLDELSNFCLQALLTDLPGAEEGIIVHFGDSMWEYQPEEGKKEGSTLPIEACFYPNLITKNWSTVYLASDNQFSSVKLFSPPELTIYQ